MIGLTFISVAVKKPWKLKQNGKDHQKEQVAETIEWDEI